MKFSIKRGIIMEYINLFCHFILKEDKMATKRVNGEGSIRKKIVKGKTYWEGPIYRRARKAKECKCENSIRG